ncbi:hypothetical protein PLEOSDRAFT_163290 [Pleurotus ostreatus PC15]|uniref:Uncharacterized protein n=1 Tax=Pleurotus ostreatus (strain PC15) TaxID=1137138 RepID=A0A067N315_PLEO1|nr:hypothetical protein PLEOSDRAFT_163290 [Pleurotus ostreatus PC15]
MASSQVSGIEVPEGNPPTPLGPMNRLPPEILSHTFEILQGPVPVEQPWPIFTQVCRWWRSVALAHRPLWSRIDMTKPKLTRISLRRSKGAPLQLHCDDIEGSGNVHLPVWKNIVQRLGRINELHLHLQSETQMLYIFNILIEDSKIPAPQLDILEIELQRLMDLQEPIFLFMDRAMPCVRHLRLKNFDTFPWRTTSPFSRLLSLDLELESLWADSLDISALLSMLEMAPSLESLRIESHFVPLLGDPGDKIVDLPNLHHVDLSWSSANIVVLLEHLRYPLAATVILAGEDSFAHGAWSIVEILFQQLMEDTMDQPYKLSIKIDSESSLYMQAWGQAGVPLWDLTLENLPPRQETLISSQILPFFSTARVLFLSISNGDVDDYLRLLRPLPELEELHVTTLMRRPTFCDQTIMPFLPQLKILELQCDVPESYDTRTLRYIRCVVAAYIEHKRLHGSLGSLVIAPNESYRFSRAVFRELLERTDLSWTSKTGKLIGTRARASS